ncbi:MAG: ATP-binding protein [Jatrophihabitantaceae bacterium]
MGAARDAVGDAVILLDHRMRHADGSTRWFSRRTTALRRDESGQVTQVVGVLQDQTARVKIEQERTALEVRLAEAKLVEERARLEAQLHQAQRLETVGQLAGGIAHDFNNLLAGIMTYASLVSSGLEELASRGVDEDEALTVLSQDVDEIVAGAKRAAELTRQLLIFSRREVVQPTVLDLNSVVADLEKLLRRTIGERIELRTAVAADAPHILADRGQVEQILMNLAVNARYSMPDRGQLRIETGQVELGAGDVVGRTLAPGTYTQLTVSDTGTGMTTEVVDRAFEPFFSTKPEGEGSGLGLATVYGIATQAGGDVSISSEVGLGTIVRVLFPAITEAVTGPGVRPARRPSIGRGETILLVEDEATVREPARRILARNGYTVLSAGSGDEALEIVSSGSVTINLLLTDVVMPGRSGKELAGHVAALVPRLGVVYMSGHSGDVIAHEGVLHDGVTLLEKPFSADDLLGTVRAALDGIRR